MITLRLSCCQPSEKRSGPGHWVPRPRPQPSSWLLLGEQLQPSRPHQPGCRLPRMVIPRKITSLIYCCKGLTVGSTPHSPRIESTSAPELSRT